MKQEPERQKEVSFLRFCLVYLMLFAMFIFVCWIFYVVLLDTIAVDWAYIEYGRKYDNDMVLIGGFIVIPLWIGWMVEILKLRLHQLNDKHSD